MWYAIDMSSRARLRSEKRAAFKAVKTAKSDAKQIAEKTDADTVRCSNEVPGVGTCQQPVTKIRLTDRKFLQSCVRCYWRSLGKCWTCGALVPPDYNTDALCVPCRITQDNPPRWKKRGPKPKKRQS